MDIQNVYNFKTEGQAFLNMRSDAEGNAIEDPNNPGYYQPYLVENLSGTVLPTIGLIFEF